MPYAGISDRPKLGASRGARVLNDLILWTRGERSWSARRGAGILGFLAAAGGFCASVYASMALADSVPASSWAISADVSRVRVLVVETSSEARVRTAGEMAHRLEWTNSGLLLDGKPTGSSTWRTGRDDAVTKIGALRVRGRVEIVATENGLAVINDVPIDSYLAGTLGNEMYPGWHAEALRAQAVASRTYALYRAARSESGQFAVTAGTSSQVYRGVGSESEAVWDAVSATRGQVLTRNGEPILAAFHSDSGGRTASSAEVWGKSLNYLRSVKVVDEGDSPDTYWRSAISRTTLRRAMGGLGRNVGKIRELVVVDRADSGRVMQLRVVGSDGQTDLTGRELRGALGTSVIRSTLFEIRGTREGFAFVGSGSGHGVGMSQWGARAMAERGAGYREILEHFYPGARLEHLADGTRVTAASQPTGVGSGEEIEK